jgi:stearoyl-CoA desaturase (delta-9 desaturase)
LQDSAEKTMESRGLADFDPLTVNPSFDERTLKSPGSSWMHVATTLIGVVGPIVGLIAAMAWSISQGYLDLTQFMIFFVGINLTGMGITIGYHRLLTHRSFEATPAVRAFWTAMGALAVQESPLKWVAAHRKHHALSDRPGDPHSPSLHEPGFFNSVSAFWNSHMGWLFTGHLLTPDYERYTPDLLRDPLIVWFHKTWLFLWFPLAYLLPTLIAWLITGTAEGALLGFLWGGCARVFVVQHAAFTTNSICHLFGSRDYQSHDDSRNNYLCALFSSGEGFHNSHHAFPSSARHGLEWWQFDTSWYVIWMMQKLGLAWNVKLPTAAQKAQKRLR